MTSLPQPWISSLNTIKTLSSAKPKLSSFKVSFSLNSESPQPISEDSPETTLDPVKLAFEKAKAYKKLKESNPDSKNEQNRDQVADSVKAAMEKAKEYKNNKGIVDSGVSSGLKGESRGNSPNVNAEKKVDKKEELKISSIDFMGLNFADKKEGRGLPAGLVPVSDPFPEGENPEVEIIVGDTSNFGDSTASKPEPSQGDNSDFYKPKVSTWGVFPRPVNISKTFGGGKVIRPGDVLETAEDRAAKEERTKQLIAAYKKKVGLNVDPKLKFECEKALKDGDSLMDSGQLKEALPYYEKVMKKMAFKSELHGLAALQWSICQDSLRRPKEARVMYEKLQSHPNATVSKRAQQFMFSFQAMEMMKVTNSKFSTRNTGYRSYFEAFVEDKTNYLVQEAGAEKGIKGCSWNSTRCRAVNRILDKTGNDVQCY
ncbi:Cytochrome C oxidase subunit [Melia azedarach]|uniref:Cytochrome C oxidase subunit n=1 Tax=Melia azedarach TaxID=155640 RepID=A0ACC1XJH2_MELAZ|nr:Cytochrome C oxidase subunit [Melia azedarach]